MKIEDLAAQASQLIPKVKTQDHQIIRPLPGVALLHHTRATAFEASIYQPVFCLIVMGAKQTTLGAHTFGARAGQCLLVSHDLPVLSRITAVPYLSVLLDLDVNLLRSTWEEISETQRDDAQSRAMEVQRADPHCISAVSRYLELVTTPNDVAVLGPLVMKELHYRLLMAPFGGVLRRLVHRDSAESAVARAISQLRQDFRSPMAVHSLARTVGMSVSAFHKHFKHVTSSSPLQYQKELRLLEARRQLLRGGVTVSTAAFDVGYESPNQFSREYARKFGVPPSADILHP